jgi:hypothetical protein
MVGLLPRGARCVVMGPSLWSGYCRDPRCVVMEPSLMVGLLPRRAVSGEGALPNGRATALAPLTQHSIIKPRQLISLAVNNVIYRSLYVSFLPQVGCAAVPRPGFDILRQQPRPA